jgi:hypothetical protein
MSQEDYTTYGSMGISLQWYDYDLWENKYASFYLPTDTTGSFTLATREWVQANVSGGSGLG